MEGEELEVAAMDGPEPLLDNVAFENAAASSDEEGGQEAQPGNSEDDDEEDEYLDAVEEQSDRVTSCEEASSSSGDEDEDASPVERVGCRHYARRCKLWAPCCDAPFWCRHCHDEAMHDNNPDPRAAHKLDRKSVKEVLCMLCDTRQPAGERCANCDVQFAKYFCGHCNLYDDDTSKQQYHCDKCGICRVGGADKYFHCDTCGCCFATALQPDHKCIERNMHSNCPVCIEYLFDSTKRISVLKCGHTMHEACFNEMLKSGRYACPVCEKSACDMARTWELMDQEIQHVTMPEEYRDKVVEIYCNDCEQKSSVKFHVLGHKCQKCGSYNTARV